MNPNIYNPCYKCERRSETCHATCEDYAEYDRLCKDDRAKLAEWKNKKDVTFSIGRVAKPRKSTKWIDGKVE